MGEKTNMVEGKNSGNHPTNTEATKKKVTESVEVKN